MAESAGKYVPQNGNFVRATSEFANNWLEPKKGRKRRDKCSQEMYREGVKILFSEVAAL